MSGEAGEARFGSHERGIQDRLGASAKDTRRRAAIESVNETTAALSFPDYSGDVFMLIAQAQSIDAHSLRQNDSPRLRKQAAVKLLSIYNELLTLARKARRDPDGVLLRPTMFGDLVPWTDAKPRAVDDIAPFSRESLLLWTQLASEPDVAPAVVPAKPRASGPAARQAPKKKAPPPSWQTNWQARLPAAERDRFAPGGFTDEDLDALSGKPRPKPAPPDPDKGSVFLQLIKTPGMSYATEGGRLLIYSAVLRALLVHNLTDVRALQIMAAIEKVEDTTASATVQVFDTFDVGFIFNIKLHPSFFAKLAGVPEFDGFQPEQFHQRLQIKHTAIIHEVLPDFQTGERFFFIAKLMRDSMGQNKGPVGFNLVPGRTYDNGCIFLGFGTPEDSNLLEPMWMSPDGRVFMTVEREALLEGYRQGVLAAEGAVTLAYVEIAVAAALLLGPEVLAAAGETLGAGEAVAVASNAARALAATNVGRFIIVNATAVYLWLGQNWERVEHVGQAGYNLGDRIYNQGLKGFLKSLVSGDPEDILQSWASLLHDGMQGYGGYRGNRSTPASGGDDDETPPVRPAPAAAGASAGDEAGPAKPVLRLVPMPADDADGTTVPGANSSRATPAPSGTGTSGQSGPPNDTNNPLVLPALLRLRGTTPGNSNRMTNPACEVGDGSDEVAGGGIANQQQRPVAVQATGTGGPVVMDDDNQPTGSGALGTSASSKASGGTKPPVRGSVRSSSSDGGKRGGSRGGRAGGGGTRPPAGDDARNDNSKKPLLRSVPLDEEEDNGQTQAGGSKNSKAKTPDKKPDRKPDKKAGSGDKSAGTVRNRGTAGGAPNSADRGTRPRIRLGAAIIKRFKLSAKEVEIVEATAESYVDEMAKRSKLPPHTASSEAHKATQKTITNRFPEVTAEEPTGMTDKAPRNKSNLKTSDLQVSRQGTDKKDPTQQIGPVIELKRTAGFKDGRLIVKGRDFGAKDPEYDNSQLDAYQTMSQELGIGVLLIDRTGKIYAPGVTRAGEWTVVGGPEGGK